MAPFSFSLSCAATVACAAYAVLAFVNLYRLMNPLWMVDLDALYPPDRTPYVRPLWSSAGGESGGGADGAGGGDGDDETLGVRVYLSHLPEFSLDFLDHDRDGDDDGDGEDEDDGGAPASAAVRSRKAVLLWEDPSVPSPTSSRGGGDEESSDRGERQPLTKSFVITTRENMERSNGTCSISDAVWSDDDAESDGRGVSIILTAFDYARDKMRSLGLAGGRKDGGGEDGQEAAERSSGKSEEHAPPRNIVHVDKGGPIWKALMNNRTVNVHVILTRGGGGGTTTKDNAGDELQEKKRHLATLSRTNRLLLGNVPMIKHDEPIPRRPTRILPMDMVYLFRKYIMGSIPEDEPAPWDNPSTATSSHRVDPARLRDHENYHRALRDKRAGVTYSYWKPEVAVRLVPETTVLPYQLAVQSGLHVVKTSRNTYGYLPPLHADEIGLTSDKYVPLNETVTDLPLRITLDAMSAQRYRLLSHMSNSLESQRALGFDQSDIDDVRRLISDTNVTLLAVTCLASVLHLLFEFLTFKSEVEFWKSNKDLTGLSVRALFVDVACQLVVLAYLVEMDSSLLMTVPAAIGILIAAWKCQKACKFQLVRSSGGDDGGSRWSLFGWTVEASRLRKKRAETSDDGGGGKPDKNGRGDDSKNRRKGNGGDNNKKKTVGVTKDGDGGGADDGGTTAWREDELDVLSLEVDRRAFGTVGKILFPLVAVFALRSLFMEEHSGWYSWLITSASGSVYALGFVLMTPQLFLNYKLKSVAHLPWKVLCYKFLNTFIDDLFAFIIRMPTMARISCFRDDVVFVVYLFQRWTYPVDESRPVEGRGGGGGNAT